MTSAALIPAIHRPTTYWFYDNPHCPEGGVVMYGERAWPSFALWMIC